MAKRISRRELIEKIRWIEAEERILRHDNESLIEKLNDLNKRFMELGSQVETYDDCGGVVKCIEIKPQQWGKYAELYGDAFSDGFVEATKRRLVDDIVKGLMKFNVVQFIVKDDLFPDRMTVAAKLWVIPWEKMVKKGTVKLHG